MSLPTKDAIDDDELLYRRVLAKPDYINSSDVTPLAFKPTKHDTTGLSLHRASLLDNNPERAAALGQNPSGYYIAVLQAGQLRQLRLIVEPAPTADDPSHAEITNLTYGTRKTAESKDWQRGIADQCVRELHGPFPGTPRTADA